MTEITLNQALLRAAAHAEKGQFDQVRLLCEAVLKALPPASATAPSTIDPPKAQLDDLLTLYNKGQWSAAAELAQGLARQFPRTLSLWNILGAAHAQLGNHSGSTRAFRRAIKLDPLAPEAHNNLGNMLKREGKLDEAAASYRRALALNPDYADAYNNLGTVLQVQGQLDQAVLAYQRALTIKPSYAEALYNLGITLRDLGNIDEALAAYERALAIKPDFADAHSNMGIVLLAKGRFADASAAYDRAISAKPHLVMARLNRSLSWLVQGNFEQGWPEFEWRWKQTNAPKRRTTRKPEWLGQNSLKDKVILLWGEQGLGDQIQFVRYAPMVAALGGRVIIEVNAQLIDLFSGLPGVAQVVSDDAGLPDDQFDYHCPLMSLPLAFSTDLESIPRPMQLRGHAHKVGYWQSRVGKKRPRVGLVWSGNGHHKNDRNRSIALSKVAVLFEQNLEWISLQKEVREHDQQLLSSHASIRHFGSELKDFSDTAALCEQCDLVISVDTSVAHLAASLGRPVWLLLPFAPDWRWLLDRDDSPWYPSMKLYRQDRVGDWDGVLSRVNQDLLALSSEN